MDVKVTKPDTNLKLEPHHIYLKGGQVVSVMAYTYRVHLNEQMVYFYDSESKSKTSRNQKAFWQLGEVAGVVASSRLAELPPIVQMQKQIDALATRMDAFENNLSEIVKR